MLANEVTGCLAHGYDVQLTMLGDVVCVFPVCCTKSAETHMQNYQDDLSTNGYATSTLSY